MTETDLLKIESALALTLPRDYRDYLAENDDDVEEHGALDDVTALRDADQIIEATRDYRQGFAGLPPWPQPWLYLGDEADACPYALDCQDGRLRRLDKGHPTRPPLNDYPSFAAFQAHCQATQEAEFEIMDRPETWSERLLGYLPLLLALILIFVIIPLFALSIQLLYRWLIHGEIPLFEP